jgi:alginate O-acetyltransferase complex protein AlgI
MVFSGITFLVYFLPVFLLLYHLSPPKLRNGLLLIGSVFFYSWGGPKFIFAILGTTFLDFHLVGAMHRSPKESTRKQLLVFSVLLNVGLLFYFKYCNFFIENVNALLGTEVKWLNVVLPIGISFYTFESLTYVVDVYRKVHAPLTNFWNYQTYILFFPKLIAGPIVRYNDIADQIVNREKNDTAEMKISGFVTFCLGLSKKSILANTLGMQADQVFNLQLEQIDTLAAWTGALAYTFQIYFDFSGYSDMAIGLAKIMGFRLPENFNNPYTSASITEFWRRWHITLGTWMKNYLYIPLGGNKGNNWQLYRNLVVVFLLSGFWHGAKWNFIIWGAWHGSFLVLERLFLSSIYQRIGKYISIPITFIIVVAGWVFFRLENLGSALQVIGKMFTFQFFEGPFAANNDFIFILPLAAILSFFALVPKFAHLQTVLYREPQKGNKGWGLVTIGIVLYYLSISFIATLDFNPFIYFRF